MAVITFVTSGQCSVANGFICRDKWLGIPCKVVLRCEIYKGFLIIRKVDLESLLDKNLYDTANNKLKIWKSLHWIETENKKRITKKVWNPDQKQYERSVFVVLEIHEALKQLDKG